jgi:DNA-binding MarR family transcriptional regulator
MSGILDRLEKRGLITRYPDPSDSRAKLAAITEAGEEIVLSGREIGLGLLGAAEKGLSKREIEQLGKLLNKIKDNLQSGEAARTKELQS